MATEENAALRGTIEEHGRLINELRAELTQLHENHVEIAAARGRDATGGRLRRRQRSASCTRAAKLFTIAALIIVLIESTEYAGVVQRLSQYAIDQRLTAATATRSPTPLIFSSATIAHDPSHSNTVVHHYWLQRDIAAARLDELCVDQRALGLPSPSRDAAAACDAPDPSMADLDAATLARAGADLLRAIGAARCAGGDETAGTGGHIATGGWCLKASKRRQACCAQGNACARRDHCDPTWKPEPYPIPWPHARADVGVAGELAQLFRGASVLDLGAGVGQYGQYFRAHPEAEIRYAGYDGAGNVEEYTKGFLKYADLTWDLGAFGVPVSDWVLSLEVGEHVPYAHEDAFVQNLHALNREGVVLSWAVPGQGGAGHVNERRNADVVATFEALGYVSGDDLAARLRAAVVSAPWLRGTIMVFLRTAQPTRTPTRAPAAAAKTAAFGDPFSQQQGGGAFLLEFLGPFPHPRAMIKAGAHYKCEGSKHDGMTITSAEACTAAAQASPLGWSKTTTILRSTKDFPTGCSYLHGSDGEWVFAARGGNCQNCRRCGNSGSSAADARRVAQCYCVAKENKAAIARISTGPPPTARPTTREPTSQPTPEPTDLRATPWKDGGWSKWHRQMCDTPTAPPAQRSRRPCLYADIGGNQGDTLLHFYRGAEAPDDQLNTRALYKLPRAARLIMRTRHPRIDLTKCAATVWEANPKFKPDLCITRNQLAFSHDPRLDIDVHIPVLISTRQGKIPFYVDVIDGDGSSIYKKNYTYKDANKTEARVNKDMRYATQGDTYRMEKSTGDVPMIMLNSQPFAPLLQKWMRVLYDFVFVKIDIEGSEYSVLPTLPCLSSKQRTLPKFQFDERKFFNDEGFYAAARASWIAETRSGGTKRDTRTTFQIDDQHTADERHSAEQEAYLAFTLEQLRMRGTTADQIVVLFIEFHPKLGGSGKEETERLRDCGYIVFSHY